MCECFFFFVAETCLIQYLSILGVFLINCVCGSNMENFSLSFIVLKNLERVRNEENKVIYLWLSSAIFLFYSGTLLPLARRLPLKPRIKFLRKFYLKVLQLWHPLKVCRLHLFARKFHRVRHFHASSTGYLRL